jgi:hypothetical protein
MTDVKNYQKHIDAIVCAQGKDMPISDAEFLANEYGFYTNAEFDALPVNDPRRNDLVPAKEAEIMMEKGKQMAL